MTDARRTEDPAVHRTDPADAADEGYPIDEVEGGTRLGWAPVKTRPAPASSPNKRSVRPGSARATEDHQD